MLRLQQLHLKVTKPRRTLSESSWRGFSTRPVIPEYQESSIFPALIKVRIKNSRVSNLPAANTSRRISCCWTSKKNTCTSQTGSHISKTRRNIRMAKQSRAKVWPNRPMLSYALQELSFNGWSTSIGIYSTIGNNYISTYSRSAFMRKTYKRRYMNLTRNLINKQAR